MGTSLEKVWLILLKGIGSIALWLIFQERRRLDPNELFRVGNFARKGLYFCLAPIEY